jgi:malonyl-CoA decarboxylase
MSPSFFHDMLGSIADRGRALLERSGTRAATTNQSGRTAVRGQSRAGIEDLCRALLTGRGEASGVALARQILDLYASLPAKARVEFFHILARDFGPDQDRLRAAWAGYEQAPSPVSLQVLLRAVEPPRQELFRRLNLAPGGTRALVMIREDMIEHASADPELASVEDDLVHLLYSWFNRGFLVMQRITWSTPADILERLIRYEAVHTIQGWAWRPWAWCRTDPLRSCAKPSRA